jgi:PAS domain S-box-containing protein
MKIPMIADLTDAFLSKSEPMEDRILHNTLTRIDAEPARVRTDAQGRVTAINPAFSALCGFRFEEIQGLKPGSLLQGRDTTTESILVIREAIRECVPCSLEMVNYHKDKSPYRVNIQITPLFKGNGELEGFEAIERKLD